MNKALPVIKVVIVDDHQMFIDGITSLLRREKHIQFVKEANNADEAFDYIKRHDVDILITDISMGDISGVELTKMVKAEFPEVKVLVLSMHNDREIIGEILLAEAEGYILKNTGKGELLEAINNIINGDTFYSKEVLRIMMQKVKKQSEIEASTRDITDREREIINLIAQELTTAEIADKLFISPRTVDTHRKNIMSKVNAKTVVGVIKFAFKNGLIDHSYP